MAHIHILWKRLLPISIAIILDIYIGISFWFCFMIIIVALVKPHWDFDGNFVYLECLVVADCIYDVHLEIVDAFEIVFDMEDYSIFCLYFGHYEVVVVE